MSAGGTRVLVVGGRSEVALAATRALGRRGFEVGATGDGGADPVRWSRHAARYHVIPTPYDSVQAWRSGLSRVVRRHGYEVAVATSDATLAAWRGFDIGVPTVPRLEPSHAELTDKGRLAALAVRAGVPYPRTLVPAPEDDASVADSIAATTIVKPAHPAGTLEMGTRVPRLPRPRLVRDSASAARAIAAIRRGSGDPVVQEYLAGAKFQAAIVRRDGLTTCRLALRVVREYPAGGAEAMLTMLDSEVGRGSEMVSMLERLADTAQYEGLLQAEFILSSAGKTYLMDPNPRLGGSLSCVELFGVRLAEHVVLDALGLPVPSAPREQVGRSCHDLVREVQWLLGRRDIPRGYVATMSLRDAWRIPPPTDPLPELRRALTAGRRLARPGHKAATRKGPLT